jgi:hypothetical protein
MAIPQNNPFLTHVLPGIDGSKTAKSQEWMMLKTTKPKTDTGIFRFCVISINRALWIDGLYNNERIGGLEKMAPRIPLPMNPPAIPATAIFTHGNRI